MFLGKGAAGACTAILACFCFPKLLKVEGYDFGGEGGDACVEVVAGVEGSAREVLEAYINHTLIGADELCHTLAFNNDEEEAEVDDAFAKLEANFFTANA